MRSLPYVLTLHDMGGTIKTMISHMEPWEDGTLGRWNLGKMEPWEDGTLGRWNLGKMEPWEDGTLGRWNLGKMEPWEDGTLGRWNLGKMELPRKKALHSSSFGILGGSCGQCLCSKVLSVTMCSQMTS